VPISKTFYYFSLHELLDVSVIRLLSDLSVPGICIFES
jgi:hypothetical protein